MRAEKIERDVKEISIKEVMTALQREGKLKGASLL